MADGGLVGAAQRDRVGDLPECTQLEGVRGIAGRVVGIAIARIEAQVVAHGDAEFDEILRDVVAPGERQGGTAGAGPVARTAWSVGTEVRAEILGLDADGRRNPARGARQRERGLAGQHGLYDALPAGTEHEGRIGDVALQRLAPVDNAPDAVVAGQPALEEVVRNTGRVAAVQGCHTGRRTVDADHVDRAVDGHHRQVVAVLAGVLDVGRLVGDIEGPALADVAAHAVDRHGVLVGGDVLTRSAFDVALQGIQRRAVADDVAIADRRGQRRKVAEGRCCAREVRRVVAAHAGPVAANRVVLLLREQWVVAGQGRDVAEGPGVGDLRIGLGPHRSYARVRFDGVRHLVVAEEADVQPHVRALEEVGRVVVEGLPGPGNEFIPEDLEIEPRDRRVGRVDVAGRGVAAEVRPATRRNRGRAAAGALATRQRAGGDVVVALQDRPGVGLLDEARDMAAAVQHAAAEGERELVGLAGDDVPVRHLVVVGTHQVAELAVVVGVLIAAVHVAGPETLEVVVEDEVDHAGHRVRAVHGGGAPGQDFHPLQQQGRYGVEVGAVAATRGAGRQALAVDQHQGPGAAEIADIHRRRARGAVRCGDRLARGDLRQIVQVVLHAGDAAIRDVLGLDRGDLGGTDDIGVADPGARDHDLLDFDGLLALGLGGLHADRRGDECQCAPERRTAIDQ